MAQENPSYEKQLVTPLGILHCGITCEQLHSHVAINHFEAGQAEVFNTAAHQITLVSFQLTVPEGKRQAMAGHCGWIFRIEKTADIPEQINTYCFIDNSAGHLNCETTTGEHLLGIQISHQDWVLHLGTEDGEMLRARAEHNDWFPERLKNKVDAYQSVTTAHVSKLHTVVPDLCKGEKLHIHYLAAYGNSPESNTITWLAVDKLKKELDVWIGL